MARGLSPVLPLGVDPRNGYGLHQNVVPMIIQNLKMVILTIPGERAMDPLFGVGLKKYLFEPDQHVTYEDLKARIVRQVGTYMPFLTILEVDFKSIGVGNAYMQPNYTHVTINFRINPLKSDQTLEIKV